MGTLTERLAILIDSKADGAIKDIDSLGTSAEKAAVKVKAAAEAQAAAQSKARLAAIASSRAQVDLTAAQKQLAAVVGDTTASDERKRRAALAVQAAEVRHADATRASAAAELKAVEAEKAHTAALAQVETGAGRTGSALKSAVGAGALAAGAAVAGFAIKSVGAASDLSESVSKAGVVFGQATGEVLAFGDGAAKAIGQSKQSALEAASSFGALFEGLGIGPKRAADLSLSLVKLSSDLASFNNADPADVIEAVTAAFRGEYDAVQRFVPTISAAAVETEALRETHKRTAATLSASEKGLATYTLIMQGTKQAQGDFARTSGGLANQQRIAAASATDLAASTGRLLLPAVTAATKAANAAVGPLGKLADELGAMPPEAKAAAVSIVTVAAGAKTAASVLPKAREVVSGLATGIKGLSLGTVAAGGAVTAFAAVAGVLVQKLNESKKAAGDFLDTLISNSGATDAAGQLKVLQNALANTDSATKLNNEQAVQAIVRYRELQKQVANESQAAKINAGAHQTAKDSTAAYAAAAKQSSTFVNRFGETVDRATGKIKDQKSEIDRLTGAIDSLNGKNIAAAQADIEFRNSLESLRTSVRSNGKSLGENTQKGRDNRAAFIAAAQAAQRLSETVADTKGYDAGRAALIRSRAELERAATRYGLTRSQVDGLISSILRIPAARSTQLRTPGLDSAIAKFRDLAATIERVDGRAVSIRVGVGPLAIQARSKGGEVTGGIPGRDSVPSLLMPGERVLTVAENRAYKLRLRQPGSAGQVTGAAVTANLTVNIGRVLGDPAAVRAEVGAAFDEFARKLTSGAAA